jgi:hypothetical protein
MPTLIVKGTPINIPSSGASADWSPAVIEAFQALADAVNTFTGTFDVAPQKITIDAYNPGTNIAISNLVFPPSDVRSVTVFYTIYRKTSNTTSLTTDGVELTESGSLEINYNASRTNGLKWDLVRVSEGEDTQVTFSISDLGQISFSSASLSGINHTGIISFRALAILN